MIVKSRKTYSNVLVKRGERFHNTSTSKRERPKKVVTLDAIQSMHVIQEIPA
jgi:hypothetical protein